MYITQLHFDKILEWFHNSQYRFLMLFLPSCDPKERAFDDYIIENQFRIDKLTGERITYISYMNSSISEEDLDMSENFVRVNTRRLSKSGIGTHIYISDEVCDKFCIPQYNLPALILISKDETYNLYPISNITDFDSYLTSISIATTFLDNIKLIDKVERNISNFIQRPYESFDKEKIFSEYGKMLNESICITNGEEILQNILFNYSSGLIEMLNEVKEKSNKINIIIERLNKRVGEEGFDVFISSKSEDYQKAKEVYNYLKDNGHKPFLADPVLREIGTDNYGYLIRQIVNKCRFMIVYASNVEYMNTTYVSSEWNQFLDELSSGIKYGKLFSIISPSISAKMLPAGLSVRQFFTTENYKKSLLQYLRFDELFG